MIFILFAFTNLVLMIIDILKQIYPELTLTPESLSILSDLLNDYEILEPEELIHKLNNQKTIKLFDFINNTIKIYNITEPIKIKKYIIETLIAGIIELAGGATISNKLKRITAYYIWSAIFNDEEYKYLFESKLPIVLPYVEKQVNNSKCNISYAFIKLKLEKAGILYEPIIIKLIKYLLNDYINKNKSCEHVIDKIILNAKGKLTYTALNEIVKNYFSSL